MYLSLIVSALCQHALALSPWERAANSSSKLALAGAAGPCLIFDCKMLVHIATSLLRPFIANHEGGNIGRWRLFLQYIIACWLWCYVGVTVASVILMNSVDYDIWVGVRFEEILYPELVENGSEGRPLRIGLGSRSVGSLRNR